MDKKPLGAGKSSFDLIDSELFFSALGLQEDAVFLDVACGRGAYSLAAARHIGPAGRIYAFDLWEEGIESLQKEIRLKEGNPIVAQVVDVSRQIPLENQSVDVCLLATVLHDLIQDRTETGAIREIERVLKPGGTLAVIEFKKIEGPPGPPVRIRIAPEEVEERLQPHSFSLIRVVDLGPFNYLALFELK
jgi:ubiquinone/menaquinone biosynthesis C-methylase UbiE